MDISVYLAVKSIKNGQNNSIDYAFNIEIEIILYKSQDEKK